MKERLISLTELAVAVNACASTGEETKKQMVNMVSKYFKSR
jgi:hypothetical protein